MHLIQPCLIVSVATLHFSYFHSDLVNVFEVFIPQLLIYPNASDPLNGDAAALMMRDRAAYEQKVKGSIRLICFALLLIISSHFSSNFNWGEISSIGK
jgi:hypothetical protein